jgi:peptidoglycan/xylan/chitin deacetylase (PgdA/CDA1 family)
MELLVERDPRVLYGVDAPAGRVALTLDDGPDESTTPRLLEVLARNGARATFFLVGERVAGHEHLVAAIVSRGHEIGNHMMRDAPSVDLTPEAFEAELLRTRSLLAPFGPQRWFRPGSGWYDDWMFPILDRHGYRMVLGTAYPLDAALPWVWLTSRLARWQVDPGDILILHDGGDRGARTARTLERVLPDLARRGLRAVTVSELVAEAPAERGRETTGASIAR